VPTRDLEIMPAAQETIRPWLTAHREAAVGFLAELVRTPSDNPPGDCLPIAKKAAGLLEKLGLRVERHAVPDALVRERGMMRVTNLIVRERFGAGGPTLALNAHGDVVPPGEGWSVLPYSAAVKDGQMFGRGVAVSKSDFATYTFALLALKAAAHAGALLRGSVELHFTFDEEVGGDVGPGWLLAQGLTRPSHAICAGFAFEVVTAHNGCLHLEVDVRGKSAHAARPHLGADALEAATQVLQALYAGRGVLGRIQSATTGIGHPTLVVGKIEGGINTNVVPDRIRFRLDRRMVPEETPADVEGQLRQDIAKAAVGLPGITVEVNRLLLAQPLRQTEASRALGERIARHAQAILGTPIPLSGVPLYTDARHYAAAGVPVVLYGAGPQDPTEANAHGPDERLRLNHLHAATEVVALAASGLLAE
jgi:succinyl-diaminopimelate desuccinylase